MIDPFYENLEVSNKKGKTFVTPPLYIILCPSNHIYRICSSTSILIDEMFLNLGVGKSRFTVDHMEKYITQE